MDKPADPATPFGEVYQSFYDDLAKEGHQALDHPPTGLRRGCQRLEGSEDQVESERELVAGSYPAARSVAAASLR